MHEDALVEMTVEPESDALPDPTFTQRPELTELSSPFA